MFSFRTVPEAAYSFSFLAFPLGPMIGFMEGRTIMNFGYSKFAGALDKTPQIPSKPMWLLVYSMPIVTAAVTYKTPAAGTDTSVDLVLALNVLHYVKRDLECLFVHKYSGGMNILTCGAITGFYMLCAFVHVGAAQLALSPSPTTAMAGIAIYIAGQLGNLYHHYLLSTLRKPGEKGYKVPRGGLFSLVCCPHYFFELIAWLGVAVAANHPAHFYTLFGFTCYLIGRSHTTMKWYQDRMTGKDKDQTMPQNWKRLIPFVF